MTWLMTGLPVHEAYLERAGMNLKAGAFLQARDDAQSAADTTEDFNQVPNVAHFALQRCSLGYHHCCSS